MPIYAYKCDACGHALDVLQKMSDAPLTDCPACGAVAFKKQLTAAGFQLKGSGWYATDFKGGGATPAGAADAKTSTVTAPATGAGSAGTGSTEAKSDSKPSETSATKAATPPAASAGGCGSSCACH